ncbi:MAG: hypothetical protein JSS96_15505, partial [Bacteroidetes bacterium]|nr:hypothetical protein [Bacteroidota bacterium]
MAYLCSLMSFELPLTEEKVKPHQSTAMHLMSGFIFSGTGAIFLAISQPLKYWGIALLIAGLLLLVTTVIKHRWLVLTGANRIIRIAELLVFLCLTSFCATNKWWVPTTMFGVLSASILMALLWENGENNLRITVDEQGIKLPVTSRKRFIDWSEVEKVLLRYGTLTVDCADNRLFQWNVKKTDVDAETFD